MKKRPPCARSGRAPGRVRRALLLSFEIARKNDPTPSLAIGSLLAYARAHADHGRRFVFEHEEIRLDGVRQIDVDALAHRLVHERDLSTVDLVAIATYAWSEQVVSPLMGSLRQHGFCGVFALGGYQITRSVGIEALYPEDARYLIEGPAERELLRVLLDPPAERVLAGSLEVADLASPYLTGVIDVVRRAPMVRMETQRGCRWRCKFCSYRGLGEGPLTPLPQERIAREIGLFAEREVGKINVLDPEFNGRSACTEILEEMIRAGLPARVSLQARPENLVQFEWAARFLDLCEDLDVHLELGLQTAIPEESRAVGRNNDLADVARALEEVDGRKISHEVSLIYGLPRQTTASFANSVEFVRQHSDCEIRCFPLMLHRGTDLDRNRARFGLREGEADAFGIPYVVESDTFSEADWVEMERMATDVGSRSSNRVYPSSSRVDPSRGPG